MSKITKIEAAKNNLNDALAVYNTACVENNKKYGEMTKRHQEEIKTLDIYNLQEYKEWIKSQKELKRLQDIEAERNKLSQEIYVSNFPSGEKNSYDTALKAANAFIINKYGENID